MTGYSTIAPECFPLIVMIICTPTLVMVLFVGKISMGRLPKHLNTKLRKSRRNPNTDM